MRWLTSVCACVCVRARIMRYLFSLCVCLRVHIFEISIFCCAFCEIHLHSLNLAEPGYSWPLCGSRSQREICLSCLKWRLFLEKRGQTECSALPSCFMQSVSKPRVRQTAEREHLHNVGAWCYPAELDLSTFFFLNLPPPFDSLSLSLWLPPS